MLEIREKRTQDAIVLELEGRVDAVTSRKLQEEILLGMQKMKNLILDFEKVDYIASSGLRVLLIGVKTASAKKGSMKLLHVQKAVMDVFEMTGFHEVLNIEHE